MWEFNWEYYYWESVYILITSSYMYNACNWLTVRYEFLELLVFRAPNGLWNFLTTQTDMRLLPRSRKVILNLRERGADEGIDRIIQYGSSALLLFTLFSSLLKFFESSTNFLFLASNLASSWDSSSCSFSCVHIKVIGKGCQLIYQCRVFGMLTWWKFNVWTCFLSICKRLLSTTVRTSGILTLLKISNIRR